MNEGIDLITKEIEQLSSAIKNLKKSKLNDRAIALLIYHSLPGKGRYQAGKICGIPAIEAVLECSANLKDFYTRKAEAVEPK